MLGGLAVIYFSLAWLRLRSVARHPLPKPVEAPERHRPDRISIVRAFTDEYGRVLRDRSAFSLIVLAPIIYGVFYPQPYLGQLIKDIPIAIVDDDSSDVSRTIIQAVNADEAVKVALRPTTLAEAHAALARREVFGILSIPAEPSARSQRAMVPDCLPMSIWPISRSANRTLQVFRRAGRSRG
jgi:ABC-2 type transport system permease protein